MFLVLFKNIILIIQYKWNSLSITENQQQIIIKI